jgi:hypothetical protein
MDLPSFVIQTLTLTADLLLFLFLGWYFLKISAKERELDKKAGKIDTNYHEVVDNALTKERKILEDATMEYHQIVEKALAEERVTLEKATTEADHIISSAEQINNATKDVIDKALKDLAIAIQKEAKDTAHTFMQSYQNSLKEISDQTLNDLKGVSKNLEGDLQKQLNDFQYVAKELETDLQKQLKDFHTSLLPNLEKELEAYKQVRMQQTEQLITKVIQKVSQEILNKSFSIDDHQKLLIDSLEKAKKEGVFN